MNSKQSKNRRDGWNFKTFGTPSLAGDCTLPPATGRKYSRKTAGAAALATLCVISFATIYRVRELVAMLLLFTIGFVVVGIGVFILWLAEEAAHGVALWIETHRMHLPARRAVIPAHAHPKSNSGGRAWN